MSALAKEAREKMKAKARSFASEKDMKVDSSDWTPAEPLNADVKTGLRPISKRQFKKGGKVVGKVDGKAAAVRADRKQRKAGGRVESEKAEATEFAKAKVNRDVRAANEEREGKKHIGGFKKGGTTKRKDGGSVPSKAETRDDKERLGNMQITPKRGAAQHYKHGGKMKRAEGGETKAGLDQNDPRMSIVKPKLLSFGQNTVVPGQKKGGKVEGEKWIGKAIKKPGALHKALKVPEGEKIPAKKLEAAAEKSGKLGKRARLAQTLGRMNRATGGMVDIGAMKKGPKAKKGKTNINITINAGKPDQGAPMDMGAMPPPPMPAGVPVPMPAPPAGGPGGMPPMGGMGMAPPMMPPAPPAPAPAAPPAGMPPMPRKRGGRVAKQMGGGMGFKGAQTGGMPAGAAPDPRLAALFGGGAMGGAPMMNRPMPAQQAAPAQPMAPINAMGASDALRFEQGPAQQRFVPGAPVNIAGPGIRPVQNLEINRSATTYPTKELLTPEQMAMMPTQNLPLQEALRLFLRPQQAAEQAAAMSRQPRSPTATAEEAAAQRAQAIQQAQQQEQARKAAEAKAAADKAAAEKAAAEKAAAEKAAAAAKAAPAPSGPSAADVVRNYYLYKMMTSDRRLKTGVGRKAGGKVK